MSILSPIRIKDTQTSEEFTLDPSTSLNVYICGPTVYTASHVGHLKTYMTFDIIRRIFKNYFHLNFQYMMNITNVDDKIIRATYEKAYPDIVKGGYDLNDLAEEQFLAREKFEEYADFWENNFLEVMDSMNISPPDILSRVTEYIDEILEFVDEIDQNGYAFEDDGSVYFYGTKYMNVADEETGEYLKDPNSKHNFVLLKKARPYEPSWDSKWGKIRPGWHIECSAMASSVFGNTVDIHGGGIDLAFPHHHNEVLQSNAKFYPPTKEDGRVDELNEGKTWVKHFMHTGHLNIKGLKMSRSLKNFITIDEITKEHTPDQLRMLFLLHNWSAPMDYSDETMRDALYYVDFFENFSKQVKSIKLRNTGYLHKKFNDLEINLSKHLVIAKKLVDSMLRDNLDTPEVIFTLKNLVSQIYQYVENAEAEEQVFSTHLVDMGYRYVVEILSMFGLTIFESENSSSKEDDLIKVVSDIRADVRGLATSISKTTRKLDGDVKVEVRKIATGLYELSDNIRDKKLADLGINLTDK
jgi:cysteinyl-tRNA synthetase